MRRVVWVIAGVSALLLLSSSIVALFARDDLLELAHGIAERNDGTELADRLVSPEALLDYVETHSAQLAIASWEWGREGEGLYLNAERPQPLAAAAQLLLLAAYAEQLASGEQRAEERVALATLQPYALPDGDDAHQAALNEARALGSLLPARGGDDAGELSPAATLPLSAVVRALVRHADPAAADFLLARLGRARITELAQRHGFGPEAVPLPQAGLPQSWLIPAGAGAAPHVRSTSTAWLRAEPAAELLARYHALGPQGYADAAWKQLAQLRDDPAFSQRLRAQHSADGDALSLRERAQLAAALPPRASARACARLLGRAAASQLPGSESLLAQLDGLWPEHGSAAHPLLAQVGRLSGAVPGVITSLTYARGRDGGTRLLALFMRDLPLAVWLRLSSSFVLQQFELQLLSDEQFLAFARQRLTRDTAQPSAAMRDMHTSR